VIDEVGFYPSRGPEASSTLQPDSTWSRWFGAAPFRIELSRLRDLICFHPGIKPPYRRQTWSLESQLRLPERRGARWGSCPRCSRILRNFGPRFAPETLDGIGVVIPTGAESSARLGVEPGM